MFYVQKHVLDENKVVQKRQWLKNEENVIIINNFEFPAKLSPYEGVSEPWPAPGISTLFYFWLYKDMILLKLKVLKSLS